MSPNFSLKGVFTSEKAREKKRQEKERQEKEQQEKEQREEEQRQIDNIRDLCPQFCILIIGRANSGKTTILQKMCETDEDPIVHDEEGNELPASVLKGPDAMRGIHDIRLQITYPSKPEFKFHDSEGFESGSEAEVDKVIKFIEEMSNKTELRHRLHVIWYCIPTDGDRVASKAELSFFEKSTGSVPVILLFTKWDGQIIKACNILRRQKVEKRQAVQQAPGLAKEILEREYIPVFKNTAYPPTSYTVLGHMNKPETNCSELSEKTAAAMTNSILKKLFVSVQTHNIQLCVESAIDDVISRDAIWSNNWAPENIIGLVGSWFPHIYWALYRHHEFQNETFEYSSESKVNPDSYVVSNPHEHYFREERFEFREEEEEFRFFFRQRYREEALKLLQPIVSSSEQAFSSRRLQNFDIAASSAIVAKRSFEVKKQYKTVQEAITATVTEYLKSSQSQAVKDAIVSGLKQYEKRRWAPEGETRKVAAGELKKICLDNVLG